MGSVCCKLFRNDTEEQKALLEYEHKQDLKVAEEKNIDELREELNAQLQNLKKNYPKFSPLFPREKKVIKPGANNTISVLQFNMLADGLSGTHSQNPTEKSFVGVDLPCLKWDYRGLRIIEELVRYNADVICIQENDQFKYILDALRPYGYDGRFQPKEPSPTKFVAADIKEQEGRDIELPPDGVSIYYRSNKLQIDGPIQKISMKQNKTKVIGLAIPFRCLYMNEQPRIVVATTHLKSTKTLEGEELRKSQIGALVNELFDFGGLPFILSCDLNANPIENKKGYGPLTYEYITNELGLASAYAEGFGEEPEYTTWKERRGGTDKHVLDYIFFKKNSFNVTELWTIPQPPPLLSNTSALIPSWNYPSDHFSISATLELK